MTKTTNTAKTRVGQKSSIRAADVIHRIHLSIICGLLDTIDRIKSQKGCSLFKIETWANGLDPFDVCPKSVMEPRGNSIA